LTSCPLYGYWCKFADKPVFQAVGEQIPYFNHIRWNI
jgi:hypothetical protein